MAIAFARMTIHTRSKGHSAVAASAYRAGVSLYDEVTGETHTYEQRDDVIHAEIILPEKAHAYFLDRETLWNRVELSEGRKDSQLAKELTLALPKELSQKQSIALARSFAKKHFTDYGLAVDLALHDKGDGNPHAHLLITTRRLEFDRLSAKKARDLNPIFYGRDKSKVYDFWSAKWRDCQNDFFQAQGIDLTVDPEYLVPTKHQGRTRNSSTTHYQVEENALRQQASFETALNDPDAILEAIAERQATFTEKDIAAYIFKNTRSTADFQSLLAKVKADKQLLCLGYGEDGRERYTTRSSYRCEQTLIRQATSLAGRRHKSLSTGLVDAVSAAHGLQDEQKHAVHYLAQQGDIACLVGRAGTGKTYTMKAIHALYTQQGYTLYGAALSGIAAKTLEAETGIKSDTIYSLSRRLEEGRFQPAPKSILVIDEAGMVALRDMARLVEFAKKAHCKLILLGDPDQLQPILAGAPFKAILEHVGFVEMHHIQRQQNQQDRVASSHLAAGRIGLAIDHYAKKNHLTLHETGKVSSALIDSWKETLPLGVEHQVILAHTRKQVAELNRLAREVMVQQGCIDSRGQSLQNASGDLTLSQGDRIVFQKNNRGLGVCNGDFGTVQRIDGRQISVCVGSRSVTFDTQQYRDFTYGYAVTVHKSQGVSFDRVFTLLDGFGWDRHLTYVALTRHKQALRVFANRGTYRTLDQLKRQLARAPIRDNAIDYPLSFAERRGFDPETMLGRTLNQLAGVGHHVKDAWLFVTQYESWVMNRNHRQKLLNEQKVRYEARHVAKFVDLNRQVGQAWAAYFRQPEPKRASKTLAWLEALTATRNRLGCDLFLQHAKHRNALRANRIALSLLEKCADAHLAREQVRALHHATSDLARGKMANVVAKDLKRHYRYLQEFKLDWSSVQQAQWRFAHRRQLTETGQWEAYRTVGVYLERRKAMRKAWGRFYAKHQAPGDNPNQARNLLRARGLTQQLDAMAHHLENNRLHYQAALDFYAVDSESFERYHRRYQQRSHDHPVNSPRWDVDAIQHALLIDPETTYTTIFGEPKKRTSRELRYPDGLIVTLHGDHAGQWYSFTEGQGGLPVQAVQFQSGASYPEALAQAAQLAGMGERNATLEVSPTVHQTIQTSSLPRDHDPTVEQRLRLEKAARLWSYAKPLSDTLAARYLSEHRGIRDGLERMTFKYLDAYQTLPPALIVPAYNADGELTAIQRVFLSPETALKSTTLPTPKMTTGIMKGSAGLVQIAPFGHRVYLAEGPETAASLAMADPAATVLASFSLSNFSNLAGVIKQHNPYEVILAADNDGANLNASLKQAVFALEKDGLSVQIQQPALLPGREKTDWNDVLKARGVKALQHGLGLLALQQEWGALKALNNPHVTAFLSADKAWQEATPSANKDRLLTVRNQTLSTLLSPAQSEVLEHLAPRAFKELRQCFYSQQLSTTQRQLLQSPAWDKMLQGKGHQYEAYTTLLASIKTQIFDNLHDTAKVNRLMKPVTSLLQKIMASKIQRTELQKVAPDFYQQLQTALPTLSRTYQREQGAELELER